MEQKERKYNFDQGADRTKDHSMKYHYGLMKEDPEVIPMWVADMDFQTLPEVRQDLKSLADYGVFGYTAPWPEYFEAVQGWMERRHSWKIKKDWIVPVPGIVPAIKILIEALTKRDDEILIFTPVYHPFKGSIDQLNRTCVESPLAFENGTYSIDFEQLKKTFESRAIKMAIFCSPHNPTGNVWSEADLKQLAELCGQYGALLISDEIHMDFARHRPHIPLYQACPQAQDYTVVCTAPTKTFNLASLQVSNLIIANEQIRKKVQKQMSDHGVSEPNIFGLQACCTAYEHGDQWVDELNETIEGNAQFVSRWLKENMPEIQFQAPDGLYLFWLDCSKMHLNPSELQEFFSKEARVWFNDGASFGKQGELFMRMNAACPRKTVEEALKRIQKAWKQRQS